METLKTGTELHLAFEAGPISHMLSQAVLVSKGGRAVRAGVGLDVVVHVAVVTVQLLDVEALSTHTACVRQPVLLVQVDGVHAQPTGRGEGGVTVLTQKELRGGFVSWCWEAGSHSLPFEVGHWLHTATHGGVRSRCHDKVAATVQTLY